MQKVRKNFVWLLLSPLLVVACVFGADAWRNRGKVEVDIGSQPNQKAEEVAAIRRLSQEIKNNPNAYHFIINAGPSRKNVLGYERTNFDPRLVINGDIWIDFGPSGPPKGRYWPKPGNIQRTDQNAEESIHVAAGKSGTFLDISDHNVQIKHELSEGKRVRGVQQ